MLATHGKLRHPTGLLSNLLSISLADLRDRITCIETHTAPRDR